MSNRDEPPEESAILRVLYSYPGVRCEYGKVEQKNFTKNESVLYLRSVCSCIANLRSNKGHISSSFFCRNVNTYLERPNEVHHYTAMGIQLAPFV